jgi:hypothetical protein
MTCIAALIRAALRNSFLNEHLIVRHNQYIELYKQVAMPRQARDEQLSAIDLL